METKPADMPVICTLTLEERTALAGVASLSQALEEMTRTAINELMQNLSEKRAALIEQNRVTWEAIEKKYSLDTRKSYELVKSTGEIVEHVCQHHGLAIVFGSPGSPQEPNRPPETKKTQH